MKRSNTLQLCLLLLVCGLLIAGCRHNQPVAKVTPPLAATPAPAPAASLTASPATVERGQSVELRWKTEHAARVTIEGIGEVAASGARKITPADSATYHLSAKGEGGTAEARARVTVTLPKPVAAELTEEQLFERNVKDVFFGYDKYDIRADEQPVIQADAQFLAQHPAMKLVIEGHCDERGSEEYNMGLGENRAEQVKEKLAQQGIGAERIKIISYGKEKPFCNAETEPCWQQNRRAHIVLQRQERATIR